VKGNVTLAALRACAPGSGCADRFRARRNLAAEPLLIVGAVLPFVVSPGAAPGWASSPDLMFPAAAEFRCRDFSVSVVRREDLLSLNFRFFNLALECGGGNPPEVARKDPTQPSYLVAEFDTPQNIAEQAYLEFTTVIPGPRTAAGQHGIDLTLTEEKPGSTAALPLIAATRAAGPSRLAFRLPAGTNALPYSLDHLLNWWASSRASSRLLGCPTPTARCAGAAADNPTAGDPRGRSRQKPRSKRPWRLFLSPKLFGAWAHSTTPVTLDNRTELWHTRLAVRTPHTGGFVADETDPAETSCGLVARLQPGIDPAASSSAVHPGELAVPHVARPRRSRPDRAAFVGFHAVASGGGSIPYTPISIPADKLFLTPLGWWLDVFGDWPERCPLGPMRSSASSSGSIAPRWPATTMCAWSTPGSCCRWQRRLAGQGHRAQTAVDRQWSDDGLPSPEVLYSRPRADGVLRLSDRMPSQRNLRIRASPSPRW